MAECDICGRTQEDTPKCTSCGRTFCDRCGDPVEEHCEFCLDDEEA
ncbi:MAG: hypothetical protein GXO65_07360 [Euryarchaeota archaeon]|nr:hypothetical protein [Euryarchaeota archaeon]